MNEIDLINAYKNKEVTGIVLTSSYFFMPMRITGLGTTQRFNEAQTVENLKAELTKANVSIETNNLQELVKEFLKRFNKDELKKIIVYNDVARSKEDYANEDALNALIGLPIVLEHPRDEKDNASLLHFNNIDDNKIIGTIICITEIRDDSIWGLAKIYDLKILDVLNQYKSTSPAVVSDVSDNIDKPIMFNHLAIVEKGHWDIINPDALDLSSIQVLTKGGLMQVESLAQNLNKEEDMSAEEIKNQDANIDTEEETKEVADEAIEKPAPAPDIAEPEKEIDEDIKANCDSAITYIDSMIIRLDRLLNQETFIDEDDGKDEYKNVDEEEQDDEVIDSEEETAEDRKTSDVVDSFRNVVDECVNVKLNMPYLGGKRYKPSVVLGKILSANAHLVDSKYKLLLNKKMYTDKASQSLLDEAFTGLVNKARNKQLEFSKANPKRSGRWEHTSEQNIQIDRNF